MGKLRGRLDPSEVKRALADEQQRDEPSEPFHSPFAAARARLEKLVPAPSKPPGKATAADRLRDRAGKKLEEPSELAKVRAAHKAARQALAEAIKPLRRPARRDD